MSNIWVNGCFDILHSGHVELFEYAKSLGDHLTVGIDSDKRVKELKGDKRPIMSQDERKKLLEAIKYIDEVVIFDSEEELIKAIAERDIHVMVVGAHYQGERVIGSSHSKYVKFFTIIDGYSTSSIIKRILESYK